MSRSRCVCLVRAMATPARAITGEAGHSGMRQGRVRSRWRTRLTSAEMAISAYSAMIITAVEDTTDCRLDFAHRIVAQAPMNSVATQGAPLRLMRASARDTGPGHAWSRAVEKMMRANCSVMASEALKMAMIAPTVTMSTTVWPKALSITSVRGVSELRKPCRSGAPKTVAMNGRSSHTMPTDAAVTTALPTWAAEPAVSSEKLIALS